MSEYMKGVLFGLVLGPIIVLVALPWGIRVYAWYLDKVLSRDNNSL